MNRQMREVAIKNKWMKKYGFLDIILSFDSMVMRGSMILSTAASTRNRLIGVDLSQGHSAIESEFKAAVLKLRKATATEEEYETSMAEQLPLNKEHMVFYARAVKPGVSLCFICAAYNLTTIVAADVRNQVNEVMRALIEEHFNVRFITGDMASRNASYFRDESNIPASSFIPKDVRESCGLEGDYLIAFRHPVTKKIVFVIADPPHCLKRVGAALENRDMEFENHPVKISMLHDVFITINDVQGGVSALQYFRKLKERHFKGNNFDAMSVKRSAQVMSNTMVKAIDRVCDHADEYPMEKCPPGYDRTALYSMVRQLCVHMNRFIDLCNLKDLVSNQAIVQIGKHNADKYAKEFLKILAWFNKWQNWVKSLPGKYAALQSVCYGFVPAVYFLTKQGG